MSSDTDTLAETRKCHDWWTSQGWNAPTPFHYARLGWLARAAAEARADSAVPSSHPSALSDRGSGEGVRAPDGEIERGWLIERKAGPFGMKNYPARWWKGGVEPLTGEDCWTADANNATRFCRAVDASAALIALSWRDGARTGAQRAKLIKRVTITEHLWCDAAVHHEAPEPNLPKNSIPTTASAPANSETDDSCVACHPPEFAPMPAPLKKWPLEDIYAQGCLDGWRTGESILREALARLLKAKKAHEEACAEWGRKQPPMSWYDPHRSVVISPFGIYESHSTPAPEIDSAVHELDAAWEAARSALAGIPLNASGDPTERSG